MGLRSAHTRQQGTSESDGAAAQRLDQMHTVNSTPIEEARPAGRVQRAGPARRRRAENGGMFFFCVAIVGSALVRTRTAGSAAQRCVVHGDCQDGFFCGVSLSDSYEGWLYQASFCRPCSQCECHHDASTAKCPADRFVCLFAPLAGFAKRDRAEFAGNVSLAQVSRRAISHAQGNSGNLCFGDVLREVWRRPLCHVSHRSVPLHEVNHAEMFSAVEKKKMQGLRAPRHQCRSSPLTTCSTLREPVWVPAVCRNGGLAEEGRDGLYLCRIPVACA